ncbi:hypothetical protein LSH36_25g01026 [Paralvinella palmiformis]|uniref:peptidylprolyl isomerase n=1 Tax=Paralvinella palmiformis TaxID=53620 RepID=A0AAD9NF28_9ANNE|nr:hypothetical protein LSH36_25g01026 [Paralvinella palmiformis]
MNVKFPKTVKWQYKTDTDLYELAKNNTVATGLAFSPNGKVMAALCKDRKIRMFKFLTGKLTKVFDESLQKFAELQQMKQQLSNMEFSRRIAIDKELERNEAFNLCNLIINLTTNRCVRMIGKPENARFLHIAMFQGMVKKATAAITVELEASDNPTLISVQDDPILFCTAYKKNRFYLFTRRNPHDAPGDVFNEKPSKEEMVSATQDVSYTRISDSATIHTSMGDLHIKLFPKECPKTVENFCVHSRNGYFNGHLFHRVIKSFMIQTGDPLGNGTGGESIWGGEFEDEFHPSLKHDRPYTLSMANAGPNTNGSQFFITVVPTPWLDNKHTVFGRVIKGMEIIQSISNVKTNPKTDKPYDDVSIINITIK